MPLFLGSEWWRTEGEGQDAYLPFSNGSENTRVDIEPKCKETQQNVKNWVDLVRYKQIICTIPVTFLLSDLFQNKKLFLKKLTVGHKTLRS
jgi:hypothetical protein